MSKKRDELIAECEESKKLLLHELHAFRKSKELKITLLILLTTITTLFLLRNCKKSCNKKAEKLVTENKIKTLIQEVLNSRKALNKRIKQSKGTQEVILDTVYKLIKEQAIKYPIQLIKPLINQVLKKTLNHK